MALQNLPFRTIGVVRTMRPEDLQPYFGTYRPEAAEVATSLFFIAWFGAAGFVLAMALEWSLAYRLGLAAVLTGVAIMAVTVDARSARAVGPTEIAFRCPISIFAWSIPLTSVEKLELVQARPHHRLRVITTTGAKYSLPLTSRLWSLLAPPRL